MKNSKFPYHIQRYVANSAKVPPTHFSLLNELTFCLIAPLENTGYTLPDYMAPDISVAKMFCNSLRDDKGIEPKAFPKYRHEYADGRVTTARLYPISLLPDFRMYFYKVWLTKRSFSYFKERDPKALPYLESLMSQSIGEPIDYTDLDSKTG